ncbi:MAG TPA: hypothetical protein VME20_03645 [Acidimicrobiales bacterium]|nr:hypothetical protein [Acidimicrobiales bacterium]
MKTSPGKGLTNLAAAGLAGLLILAGAATSPAKPLAGAGGKGTPAAFTRATAAKAASTKAMEARLTRIVASAAASPRNYIQAEILPAATFAVGASLTGGPDGKDYGAALTANDISNSWSTCTSSCTLDFAFFVFSSRQETTPVEFRVLSPSNATIYKYTWDSKLDQTNWYSVFAKADYTEAGTYFAEVYIGSTLEGWVPVVFAQPSTGSTKG